ncbi:histone deacetylase, putative [Plasmodium chabaudi chabaudi]|uniref:Histone deacetylase, putative n=1 Tax=Plasmodium chabaudi chabaudi TaxID=31271 RepID=A0A4V0K8M0_PLACU|nr:histone deacetylase, putative [Plasmodium chabaudi chabaudi]VTZ69055.1 histone deacetylase, putative [Plasmodium chabaudi chabaudi]|eukprot:XP_016653925.1 histone deacetylase, putative [Plasmodium chabaudi chabaudi]
MVIGIIWNSLIAFFNVVIQGWYVKMYLAYFVMAFILFEFVWVTLELKQKHSNKRITKVCSFTNVILVDKKNKNYNSRIWQNAEKNKIENLIDLHTEQLAHNCVKNGMNILCHSLYKRNNQMWELPHEVNNENEILFLDIQKEIFKTCENSFNENIYENIFKNQKKYCNNSKNPPYVFHPIYSSVERKVKDSNRHAYTHRFKLNKYKNIFNYLNKKGECIYENNYIIPSCDISKIKKSIFTIHSPNFINKMFNIIKNNEEIKLYELDLFSDLIIRYLVEINGTVLSSLLALKHSMCMHIGGGNHHSKRDKGDGFCIFNDIAIAIDFLLLYKIVQNVIILDVDVHQGDGTAEIFQNHKHVKTISLHCKDNYPFIKKKSTIDIELNSYMKDEEYLKIYQTILNNIKPQKQSIIFYLAGVDISKDDDLGLLLISDHGIYTRDYMTYQMAFKNKIPIVTLLSGGYNECDQTLSEKHAITFRAAKAAWGTRREHG